MGDASLSTEIERKYLVSNDEWRRAVTHSTELRDGLLAFVDGREFRIRFYDDHPTLTVKGPRQGISRDEFEYSIPDSDGQILLERHCNGDILEKTRHFITFEGFEWSVDEYHGLLSGVVLAEIELPSEDTEFALPHWVGREVSGDPEYRKINMLKARRRASGLDTCGRLAPKSD